MIKLAVLSLFAVLTAVIAMCPFGWVEFNGECLYFSHSKHSWPDSEAACRRMDHSYLVTIDTAEKQKFVKDILSVLHHNRQLTFWLGSSDFAIEGSWRWVETGTGFNGYTNWGPGYPDNNETHNCLLNTWLGNDLIWVDSNCKHGNYYICEAQATHVTV